MGTALTSRLRSISSYAQVAVHAGSSSPIADKHTCSLADAITASQVVILAVPAAAHGSIAAKYGVLLVDRIVVDVSNATGKHAGAFLRLCGLLPASSVVKCFNTIDAYSLGDDGG